MNAVHLLLNWFFFQNLALVYGLGLVPALGGRQDYRFQAADFGFGVLFMTIAVFLSWGLNWLVVDLIGFGFLRTLVFVLVIASLVHVFNGLADRLSHKTAESLRIFTGPINASCAAMGLIVLLNGAGLGIVDLAIACLGAVLGFGAALALHSGIMRRMELEWLPRHFRGIPFALISLGLVSLVFMSISSLLLPGM